MLQNISMHNNHMTCVVVPEEVRHACTNYYKYIKGCQSQVTGSPLLH